MQSFSLLQNVHHHNNSQEVQHRPRNARGKPWVQEIYLYTLKNCDNQLVAVFTDIYNSSLRQCRVLFCFKMSTIIPIPKTFRLKDYRPVALTLVALKVFERLVLRYLNTATDGLLDSHPFAYQRHRLVDNASTLGLHHI